MTKIIFFNSKGEKLMRVRFMQTEDCEYNLKVVEK